MRKVLHVISSLEPGGVERRVVGQLPGLAGRDDNLEHALVSLRGGRLADDARRDLEAAGVEVTILDKGRGWDPAADRELAGVAGRFEPDLVTAYNLVAGFWSRLVMRGRWGGTVVHEGGIRHASTFWGPPTERLLAPWTRARIFNSRSTSLVWEKALGASPRHHVVCNGVAVPEPLPDHRRHAGGPPVLLTVGRLVPIKGIDIQLRALALLLPRHPDLRLRVVGDGPERTALETLATELDLTGAVEWLGYQEHPEEFYATADIFLCTSYNETFSLTLCEAMSHGMVCLGPQVGGPAEIIRHEIDGFLVPCTETLDEQQRARLPRQVADPVSGTVGPPRGVDPAAVAAVIDRAIAGGASLDPVRAAARERIRVSFAKERYVEELASCYEKILDGGGP